MGFGILLLSALTLVFAYPEGTIPGTERTGENTGTESPTTDSIVSIPSGNTTDVDFNRFRYHEESKQYYQVGSTDPCNPNMRFFANPDNERMGECDCDYYDCSRHLQYSHKTKQCYWAWSQGPCAPGEWYGLTKELKPICEKTTCPSEAIEPTSSTRYYNFRDPRRENEGECLEAGTRGYCKNSEERLEIYPGKPIPECRTSTVCYPLSVPAQQLCIHGNVRDHKGLCGTGDF